MGFLGDILLAGAALGAGLFCLLLSRRLRALTALDSGMGKAIALLSAQVDDLTRSLASARQTAESTAATLEAQTRRAETACRRLELLLASLHDLPADPATGPGAAGLRPPTPWPERAARHGSGRGAGARDTADPQTADRAGTERTETERTETGRTRLMRRPGPRPA